MELAQILRETSGIADNPVVLVVCLSLLSLLPMALLGTTSFIKISVVLSIFRNALGAGQIPSAAVSGLLSLALSLHIMAPVVEQSLDNAQSFAKDHLKEEVSLDALLELPAAELSQLLHLSSTPLREFLTLQANPRERRFFASLRRDKSPEVEDCPSTDDCALSSESFFTLLPAFILSELRSAFAIGFTIFLPFLVIDLVVANLLVGMGMVMVSPITISLPFKLLLFVACDGWFLLARGLIASYGA